MRTASGTAWSGQPWGRTQLLPPLDPASRQTERDADATMTVMERYEYTGFNADPDPVAARREAPHAPPAGAGPH
ncbi:hypothetical protein [Hymenobacter lapidarius]|uniref:hypothetical protein n=1 Tax=Hymenobacter lapidarius TaxID=1908237 RepID=UPI0008A2FDC4|nr:hypothetical protein [Hymenobacter lapidarius]